MPTLTARTLKCTVVLDPVEIEGVADAPIWRADAIGFRQQAAIRFAPSMARRIDMAKLYWQARRAMPETMDGVPPLLVPVECPVTLEELLAEPEV